MHPAIFNVFEEICRRHLPDEARVLEVGATSTPDTLLNLPALRGAGLRVGVNLTCKTETSGHSFVQVAADGLVAFADAGFDAVLCNSVLEHDPQFWRTLAGIGRVARPGALIVIGVPGYADALASPLRRWALGAARLPGMGRLLQRLSPGWESATPTLVRHDYPGDYYRFSPQAMREVLLADCREVTIRIEMRPPRLIGYGWRSAAPVRAT